MLKTLIKIGQRNKQTKTDQNFFWKPN